MNPKVRSPKESGLNLWGFRVPSHLKALSIWTLAEQGVGERGPPNLPNYSRELDREVGVPENQPPLPCCSRSCPRSVAQRRLRVAASSQHRGLSGWEGSMATLSQGALQRCVGSTLDPPGRAASPLCAGATVPPEGLVGWLAKWGHSSYLPA